MTGEEYLEYIDHFNNRRYDKVAGYFAPDITVEYYDDDSVPYAPSRIIHGAAEFADSVLALHAYTREIVELGDFWTDGTLLFAELYTELHTFKDTPPDFYWQRKKGAVDIMTNWVLYDTDGSTIHRIRIAHFCDHDPGTARYSIASELSRQLQPAG
jgi:hypothetical protein